MRLLQIGQTHLGSFSIQSLHKVLCIHGANKTFATFFSKHITQFNNFLLFLPKNDKE